MLVEVRLCGSKYIEIGYNIGLVMTFSHTAAYACSLLEKHALTKIFESWFNSTLPCICSTLPASIF